MKRLPTLFLFVLALALILPSAEASANAVTAYRNPTVRLVLDGQELRFAQDGQNLDILMLDGVTYVPLIQLAKVMGKDITWNQADQVFYLGAQPGGTDMIDDLKPYSQYVLQFRTTKDDRSIELANKTYTKFIETGGRANLYYNLEGKYSSVTFTAYSEQSYNSRVIVTGDNGAELYKVDIIGKNLPSTHTIDVRNVYQLKMEFSETIYIVDIFAHE